MFFADEKNETKMWKKQSKLEWKRIIKKENRRILNKKKYIKKKKKKKYNKKKRIYITVNICPLNSSIFSWSFFSSICLFSFIIEIFSSDNGISSFPNKNHVEKIEKKM